VGKALGGGAAVLVAAALVSGEPASAALARLALGAVALQWALTVYGPTAAVAAGALAAFAVPPLSGAEAVGWEVYALAQLLTAYALLRCLLDPTVQRIAGAAVALAAALLTGAVVHQGAGAGRWLAVFSLLVALGRVLTAERNEVRWRVGQASVVSIVLIWIGAAALLTVLGPLVPLAPPGEYVELQGVAVLRVAADPAGSSAELFRWLAIPLLLTLLRPWRRERRYADTTLAAALACVAVPTWQAADAAGQGPAGLAGVTTLLALIGGACWDAAAPPWRRQAATAALALQAALLVASPPPRPPQRAVETAMAASRPLGMVR